jgi:pimeloyl-ACP methyl ester carboxylesterase
VLSTFARGRSARGRRRHGRTGGEIDVVGYSLGARLAWALAGHPAVAVRRLVLGGLSPMEPFAMVDLPAARTALAGGPAPADRSPA